MLGRTVCAGFVAFSALVGMANLAAADRSDLRPIGVCIDKARRNSDYDHALSF